MLNLIFLQNCISPHQMPYIEALSQRDDVDHVHVIAPRLAYNERAALGWPTAWVQSSGKLSILIKPTDDEVKNILSNVSQSQGECQSYCLFSGITAFPEVTAWMKLSLGYNVKRGIITEAPYIYNKPLWMHRLRFLLKDYRYVKYFDYVFAIGEGCEKYYKGWSRHWKVVPFLYCTDFSEHTGVSENDEHPELTVCFVGSLDRRKNVIELLKALSNMSGLVPIVTIVGDGPDRDMLEKYADKNNKNIRFERAKPMEKARQTIAANDVLVLPSLHDGWGAVVNEAMTVGTIPVCSNRCGAKALIEESGFGGIFNIGDIEGLTRILSGFASDVETLRHGRAERIAWAKQNISPQAVAERFISALSD